MYWVENGGDDADSVVFAERSRAERAAQTADAIERSTTWGEFKTSLPQGEWESYFLEHFGDSEEDPPGDDEPLESEDVPGHEDGDYPEWLARAQLEWFPPELIEKHGGVVDASVLNGDFLELPADSAERVAEGLRALGHTVARTELDFG